MSRLTNYDLKCGNDLRYISYCWYLKANVSLRSTDARLVASSGFEGILGNAGLKTLLPQTVLGLDAIDSGFEVQKLSAIFQRQPAKLFLYNNS